MFKKKPNIKPLSPLRSSDRRKFADQIITNFDIEVIDKEIDENEDKPQDAAPLSLGATRNALLPDNCLSARFTTTAGPNLSPVSGTMYVGAHPGEEQRVLWLKIEDRIVPTVYTLWKHPRLVPLLHTPDYVLQKLRGGADLMIPGLARGPPFPLKATKGSIVAIASLEKPSVPMVVGVCIIDVAALQQVQGIKGHAVRGDHWDGDEIWAWSHGGKSGGVAPDHIDGWDAKTAEQLNQGVDNLSLESPEDDGEGGVLLTSDANQQPTKGHYNGLVAGEEGRPYEEVSINDRDLSTKEIDEAFWNAFLYAMHQHRNKNRLDIHHGIKFPIYQSLIISNFVLSYLPDLPPTQAASLNIKRTSWKNARKFIKALDKEKLLKSKDRDGGETVILDINFDDPAIINFVPYKLAKTHDSSADTGGSKVMMAANTLGDDSLGQRLNIMNLYRAKEQLSPIFEASNASVKALYLPQELRPIITSYIESEGLVSDTNKRLVNLDPILANAVFDGKSSLDREILAKGTVPRDALIDRILETCSPFWAITRNDETRESAKLKSGNAPKIQIVLETRSGNKTVTKVSGVEIYHVNPQPLANDLQKACASSTSINQLVGSSPKNPVQEIMVQGPQKDIVIKALERRGIHRQWIEVVNKTKGKKK